MRLFIAIQFDQKILDTLNLCQSKLKSQGVKGNYSRGENLHMTLAFIGNYDDPGKVLDAINEVDIRPFDIMLEGVGQFGDIFWVGLAKNPALESVVRRLRRKLEEYDIPYDKKKFLPHITLIRKAVGINRDSISSFDFSEAKMRVTRISLMKSERGKNGMIYTEIGKNWRRKKEECAGRR